MLRPLGMRGRMAIPCMFFAGCVIGGGPMVSVGRYGPRLGGQGGLGVSDGAQSVRLDVGGTYLLERSRRDVLVAITGRLLLDPAVQATNGGALGTLGWSTAGVMLGVGPTAAYVGERGICGPQGEGGEVGSTTWSVTVGLRGNGDRSEAWLWPQVERTTSPCFSD